MSSRAAGGSCRSPARTVIAAALLAAIGAPAAAADTPEAIRVTGVAAGTYHSCAVTDAGRVYCWGLNNWGQLGDGSQSQSLRPVRVVDLPPAVAVAAGDSHSCAITVGGAAYCWGLGGRGQLGDGGTQFRTRPVAVQGLDTGVREIAAGGFHSCAVTEAGTALCWGLNEDGQLGDGTRDGRLTPVPVSGLGGGVTSIGGGRDHSCAVRAGGVYCWGDNLAGQLGDGTGNPSNLPVRVKSFRTGGLDVTAGSFHSCAATTGGAAFCWGDNGSGQLGDGTTDGRYVRVRMARLRGAEAVAAGYGHSCAMTGGGVVRCTGLNDWGQRGDGTNDTALEPLPIRGLRGKVAAISTSYRHSCAVTGDGRVYCWGYNVHGELGDGTTSARNVPTRVSFSTRP